MAKKGGGKCQCAHKKNLVVAKIENQHFLNQDRKLFHLRKKNNFVNEFAFFFYVPLFMVALHVHEMFSK